MNKHKIISETVMETIRLMTIYTIVSTVENENEIKINTQKKIQWRNWIDLEALRLRIEFELQNKRTTEQIKSAFPSNKKTHSVVCVFPICFPHKHLSTWEI